VKVTPAPVAQPAKSNNDDDDDDKKNYVPPSPKNRQAPQRAFSVSKKPDNLPGTSASPGGAPKKKAPGALNTSADDDMASLVE